MFVIMAQHDVFFSYARGDDEPFVVRLYSDLASLVRVRHEFTPSLLVS
jgi:hypothetical protein